MKAKGKNKHTRRKERIKKEEINDERMKVNRKNLISKQNRKLTIWSRVLLEKLKVLS
jgi:hypothetical protein